MIHVVFVCHGNICRSPMAEYLFKAYVKEKGVEDKFHIESRATSYEEIGNPVYIETKKVLHHVGIDCSEKRAERFSKEEYNQYDFILTMDHSNFLHLNTIIESDPEHKVHRFLDYTKHPRDIRDPWYTRNFDETYEDICLGIEGFYQYLLENKFL